MAVVRSYYIVSGYLESDDSGVVDGFALATQAALRYTHAVFECTRVEWKAAKGRMRAEQDDPGVRQDRDSVVARK